MVHNCYFNNGRKDYNEKCNKCLSFEILNFNKSQQYDKSHGFLASNEKKSSSTKFTISKYLFCVYFMSDKLCLVN